MPETSRTVRGMELSLGLDSSTCQRLMACARRDDPLAVIAQAPGVEAMRSFVAAMGRLELDPQLLAQASRAVDEFASLVKELGPSHQKLRRKLPDTVDAGTPERKLERKSAPKPSDENWELALRRKLFASQSELHRYQLSGRAAVTVLGPVDGDPDKIELAILSAYLGYRSQPGAPPLIAGIFGQSPTALESDERQRIGKWNEGKSRTLQSGTTVLDAYSTIPSRSLVPQGRRGRVLHVVDLPAHLRGTPVDLVTASRLEPIPHPARTDFPHENSYMRMRHPTERMVLDIYVHRSIASSTIATGGAILADPRLLDHSKLAISDAWDERLPTSLALQVLGFGLEHSHSTLWPRHADASAELFAGMGWSSNDFVGYRLDVSYPLWGAYYYINFDFRTS